MARPSATCTPHLRRPSLQLAAPRCALPSRAAGKKVQAIPPSVSSCPCSSCLLRGMEHTGSSQTPRITELAGRLFLHRCVSDDTFISRPRPSFSLAAVRPPSFYRWPGLGLKPGPHVALGVFPHRGKPTRRGPTHHGAGPGGKLLAANQVKWKVILLSRVSRDRREVRQAHRSTSPVPVMTAGWVRLLMRGVRPMS